MIVRDIRPESVNLPYYNKKTQCSWMEIPVKQQNLPDDKKK